MSKKKLGVMTVIMILTLVMVTACGGKGKEVSLGVTESGSYTNDYFGVSLSFPTDWEVQDAAGMNEIANAGQEMIAGEDETKKLQLELSKAKTLNLLLVSQYPLNGPDPSPSVTVVAEKVPGMKAGKEYLDPTKKTLIDTGIPYEFKEISTVKIGGKDMAVLESWFDAGELVVTQNYYTAIIEGYAFSFIITHFDDESKAEVDKIIESITFK
ncbi:hypothetical protein J2T12_004947 [Paenibacillus anaericanus]|uniref:hypothetical protein n=1 Tax=Paenibacillus anaericanus TaxID=170367 RepID=UPI002789F542|nr:hypothetical protein [Paenibacillus anaericanus]MDQ0091510.1 hypothetical protein [Paenibacillus anaericanus]